jgi:glycosyltransferase involved in cell wall biosynthesis
VDAKAPLFAFIGRLEEQKGVDILLAAVPKILAKAPNAQVGGSMRAGSAWKLFRRDDRCGSTLPASFPGTQNSAGLT